MSTTTNPDPNGLPIAPTRGCPVSAAMLDVMLASARKGGWPAVYTVFAQGEKTDERTPKGAVYERPARRRTLDRFLSSRPDLKALLDSAAQERRDRLLSQLEDEIEKIALGPGDITQDFNKQGQVTRVRTDKRNKVYAILQLLKAHDRDQYGDQKRVEVAGQLNHAHAHLNVGNRAGYVVDIDAIQSLEPAEQGELMRLLTKIEDARREHLVPALPPGQEGGQQ